MSFRMIQILAAALFIAGCTSTSKTDDTVIARQCGPTPITSADLIRFNVTPKPDRVVIVRMIRSSCPYCKEDLQQIALMLKTGQWNAEKIQLVLMAYKKPGVESRKTFDEFVRDLGASGFPIETADLVYLDKTYQALLKIEGKAGTPILEGWKAVPFGLVFGKDGRLAYRGQFTMTNARQNQHYDLIGDLIKESCPSRLAKSN